MAKALEGKAQLVASQRRGVQVGEGDDSEMVIIQPASSNYFQVLGVKPALGRASIGEAGGRPETVLGYRLWQTRFASDPNIVGKTVRLNHQAFVVAGVMPEVFTGLARGVLIGVWVSADAWFHTLGGRDEEQSRIGQFEIAARFRPPLTSARAAAQLDAAIRGAGKHKPAPGSGSGTALECFARPWTADLLFGGGLAAVLGLVLFVACANVAQLRLAQAETRRKELGMRMALGGGKWRVARQLLVEALLLCLAGAGLGLMLARLLTEKVSEFERAADPFMDYGIRLDYRVLVFSTGALLLAVLIAGVAPALHAARLNISDVLKQSQGVTMGRRTWQRNALVTSQIAVSVTLFGVAVLFLTSLYHATEVRPGLDPHKKILALSVIPALDIPRAEWCDQVSERLAALPGVRGATYARRLPLSDSGGGLTARVEIPGMAPMGVPLNNVGGSYFSLMGTRVVAGRGIDTRDRVGAPLVAVVSQSFARTIFGGQGALGNWVRIDGKPRQVVGIAEDGPSNDLHEDPRPFVFLPFAQAVPDDITLLVETSGAPLRPQGACLRIDNAPEDPGQRPFGRSLYRYRVQRLRCQRGFAHRGGVVRRAAIRRQPAYARTGAAGSAGRPPAPDRAAGSGRIAAPGRDRSAHRAGRAGGNSPVCALDAAGCDASRPAGLRPQRGCRGGAGSGRRMAPGAPRHARRPDGSAALGIGRWAGRNRLRLLSRELRNNHAKSWIPTWRTHSPEVAESGRSRCITGYARQAPG
jgi:predicted permease